MKVGDKLAELLADNGVDKVFGVPGGQTLPLYDGISKLPGRIEHVLMRDERSAGFAADAYARFTGKTGVCDATVGPGATNLLSPLAEAYCSSIPLIAIISDISQSWEHRRDRGNASQAMHQLEMFGGVSKWQVRVTAPRSLQDLIETAFRIATTGKPGPVVVSIPEDVAYGNYDFRDIKRSGKGAVYPGPRSVPDPTEIEKACQKLLDAEKPLLVIGGGAHISGCGPQVKQLTEQLQAAVVTTISGKGIIEENHSQGFGVTGSFGNPIARDILKEADLVFFVGSKIGQLTSFNYKCPAQDTDIIHLDTDPEEIGRNYAGSIPLAGDAALGLDAILAGLNGEKGTTQWDFESKKQKHQDWYALSTNVIQKTGDPIRPQSVMNIINQNLTDEDLVVCDASLSSGWAASLLQFNTAARRFIAPRGLAGLGWGAPAAIGAALAAGGTKRVFHFAGDGGFGYSIAELEVMKRFNLPVVSVILNNSILGWIKHVQKNHFKENYVSTDFSKVDFAAVAKGFFVRSYTAKTLDDLNRFVAKEESPDGPALIEVISDQWESPVLGLH